MGFTLSSKIQDFFLLNLKFKQESRIYSHNISMSSKIWEFEKSKSQLQARINQDWQYIYLTKQECKFLSSNQATSKQDFLIKHTMLPLYDIFLENTIWSVSAQTWNTV